MNCCDPENRVKTQTFEEVHENLKDVDACIEAVKNKLDELAHEALDKACTTQKFIQIAIENESDLCSHQVQKQFKPVVDACLKALYLTNSYHSFLSLNESINDKMVTILERINKQSNSPVAGDILERMRIKPKKKGWFNG